MYATSPATARKKSSQNRRREKSAMPAGNSSRSASSSTATSDEEIIIRCPRKPLPYGGSTNNRDPDSQSTTTTTTTTTDRRRQNSGDRHRHRRSTSRCRALHQPSPVHQQQPNHYYHHQTYSLDRAYASHHAGWPPPPPSPWSASPPPWMYAAAVATGPNCYYPGPPHGPPCQPEVDERMQRLESDKDSLQMQVSILMDQIDAQTEKISDLERGLSERSYQLQRSEETLQKEMLSRSSAETRQLELLSDLSSLKLRYAALEKENLEMRGQLKRSEQDMITLVSQCYSLCGATLGPGLNRKEMMDSLQTMSQRNNSSIISGTPPRHPGVGVVETPRRVKNPT